MSTLKLIIEEDIKTAMKNKDAVTRDTLRVLKGEIERNEQTKDGKVEVSDADILRLIKKYIDGVVETGSDNGEVAVLEKYLPQQMDGNQLEAIVIELKVSGFATSVKDMGKVMQYFKANHDGTYDGKLLSDTVKRVLA